MRCRLLVLEQSRWVLALTLLTFAGCAHQAKPKPDDAALVRAGAVDTTTGVPTPAASTACSIDSDCGVNQLCVRQQCVSVTPDLLECATVGVHFLFNSSEIGAGDKTALERSARCLKAAPVLHATIEGNADERGTEEYNVALGDRRASAVSSWLQSLGASAAQMKTVSYGKENPLCTSHDEVCWAQNRRAAVKSIEIVADKKHNR